MQTLVTLSSITTLRAGTAFREGIVHQPEGRLLVVQGKDIMPDGTLMFEGMTRVDCSPGRSFPDLVTAGDVVLQTRGMSYRAALVTGNPPPMVATGSLYILRGRNDQLMPEYLVFFLNLPATQAALRQVATGSTILNLRREAVEKIQVPLPSLADQHRLVDLGGLIRQVSEIEHRLAILRFQELHALAVECGKRAGDVEAPPAPERSVGRRKRPPTLS